MSSKTSIIVICAILLLGCTRATAQSIEMIDIPAGTFDRGVPGGTGYPRFDEINFGADNPIDEVTLTGFSISSHEVSFELYREFTDDYWPLIGDDAEWTDEDILDVVNQPPGFRIPPDWPAFYMNYFDALFFCNWLSRRDGLEPVYALKETRSGVGKTDYSVVWDRGANGYRLPTEAEWEYAARAGGRDMRVMSNDPEVLQSIAWYAANSGHTLHEVGLLEPNLWGLYDILGNASEWCWDYYQPDYYPQSPDIDPVGPLVGEWIWYPIAEPERTRVVRDGGVRVHEEYLGAATRFPSHPTFGAREVIGLRVARNRD